MDRPFAPYEGTEPYIFVSYSHADSARVLPVLTELDRAGYRIWYDEGIPWTEEWLKKLEERIANCAVCLAFLSPVSVESKHCRKEIYYADKNDKPILSAYLMKETLLKDGLGLLLSVYQSVDFYNYANASAFVRRLKKETSFLPCLSNWHTDGEIKWFLDNKGLLTIEKVPNTSGEMSSYNDLEGKRRIVPWKDHRKKVISVRIENGIISIGGYAFAGCNNLMNATISENVTNIEDCAFDGCGSLTNVKIPNGVISIGDFAFRGCSNLASVTIPNSVTSIGNFAFRGCSGLTNVTISDKITSIGKGAFVDCSSLASVTIPNNVTSIEDFAFYGCSSLTNVTIPNGVQKIGSMAFAGTELTKISLPAHTKIKEDTFMWIERRK